MAALAGFTILNLIVAELQAALDVDVYDGPLERAEPPVYVVVGGGGLASDEDADEVAFTSDTQWRVMGMPSNYAARDEAVEIRCVIYAWGGGDDFPDLRSTVAGVLDDSWTVLGSRSTWDGSAVKVRDITLGDVAVEQAATEVGSVVRAGFTVRVTAMV